MNLPLVQEVSYNSYHRMMDIPCGGGSGCCAQQQQREGRLEAATVLDRRKRQLDGVVGWSSKKAESSNNSGGMVLGQLPRDNFDCSGDDDEEEFGDDYFPGLIERAIRSFKGIDLLDDGDDEDPTASETDFSCSFHADDFNGNHHHHHHYQHAGSPVCSGKKPILLHSDSASSKKHKQKKKKKKHVSFAPPPTCPSSATAVMSLEQMRSCLRRDSLMNTSQSALEEEERYCAAGEDNCDTITSSDSLDLFGDDGGSASLLPEKEGRVPTADRRSPSSSSSQQQQQLHEATTSFPCPDSFAEQDDDEEEEASLTLENLEDFRTKEAPSSGSMIVDDSNDASWSSGLFLLDADDPGTCNSSVTWFDGDGGHGSSTASGSRDGDDCDNDDDMAVEK